MTGSRYYVLLYHGVHATAALGSRNSSGKHIPRSRFEAQMRYLAKHCPLVSMSQIAAAHRGEENLPADAVGVTFDDGLLNNYTEAWPLIEEQGIPATFYLATGYIGTGRVIWTDQLEAAIMQTSRQELELTLDDRRLTYTLSDEKARVSALGEIKSLCKAMENDRKDALIDHICQSLGAGIASHDPMYAFLSWDHVREMATSPLIEFGAHTVDHVSLAKVPRATMRDQIDRSIDKVRHELGRACPFFSYPEGKETDFDSGVVAYLQTKGLDHAPSAVDGVNQVGSTDPFHIRRVMVGFEGRPFPFAEL